MSKKLFLKVEGIAHLLDKTQSIGRSSERDIVLSSLAISRYHATIKIQDEEYFIQDENSGSGTFVNKQKLQPEVYYPITEGDQIKFGNVVARIITKDPEEESQDAWVYNEKLKISEKFQITKIIDEKRTYTLFYAKNKETDLPVVIKMLNEEVRKDLTSVGKFQRECHLARQLIESPHPNLVKILYVKEPIITSYYYVMEYLTGSSLQEHIENGQKIERMEALDITLKIAQVLSFLHEKFKILHRDIHPANIILTSDNIPKLNSLNFIKGESSAKYTVEGLKTTSDLYADPNVVLHSQDYTTQSDIYSLGLTLYYMLQGNLPFNNIIALNEQEPVDKLGEPHLDELLFKMTSRDIEKRFATYTALIERLEKINLRSETPKTQMNPKIQKFASTLTKKRVKPIPSSFISKEELLDMFQKQSEDIATLRKKLQDLEGYVIDTREMLVDLESKNANIKYLIDSLS